MRVLLALSLLTSGCSVLDNLSFALATLSPSRIYLTDQAILLRRSADLSRYVWTTAPLRCDLGGAYWQCVCNRSSCLRPCPLPATVAHMAATDCPFCPAPAERVFWRGRFIVALWDLFPVAAGHALLIPRRHCASWAEATPDEKLELVRAYDAVREIIGRLHEPDAYNFGVNDGIVAGQSVMHLHMHVIPRYAGDSEDPRGGIRWVVKTPAGYWSGPHEPSKKAG